MGGHSLMAIQLLARLRRELGVELPLTVFFENPTVKGMAAEVDRQLGLDATNLDQVDALLSEIEGLSPGEAKAQLEAERDLAE